MVRGFNSKSNNYNRLILINKKTSVSYENFLEIKYDLKLFDKLITILNLKKIEVVQYLFI